MISPFTLPFPLDLEVWTDREAEIEQLVAELNGAEEVKQSELEGAL